MECADLSALWVDCILAQTAQLNPITLGKAEAEGQHGPKRRQVGALQGVVANLRPSCSEKVDQCSAERESLTECAYFG